MPAAATAASLATLLSLGSDISGLVTGLNQGLGLIQKFGDGVKQIMDGVVAAGERAVQAIRKVTATIGQLAGQSARLDSMRDAFNKMAATAGASGQELLAAMNEATLGMAKDADLIQSSMTAMMLINQRALGDVTETIPKLAQIATAAARALGEDVGYMFDSIARGIGRASPMILDNIGLTIRLSEVYGSYAAQLGKTAKQLTIVEKQTALTNAVLSQYDDYVNRLGISTGGLATKTKQFQKSIEDLKDTVGQAFMPVVQAFTQVKADLAAVITQKVIPAFRMLGRVLSEVFGTKNPFWRWIEGDVVQQTTNRIQALYANLMELRNLGPDFAGAVSEAMGIFNREMDKLNAAFQATVAKIQAELAEKIRDIWDDFRRQERRQEKDFQDEQRRSKEDHLDRMRTIQKRYNEDITDAIRRRDARALLDLMRRQKEELSSEEKAYQKSNQRAQEDRDKERERAREDARRRAADARESAAEQIKALEDNLAKAQKKLERERNKQLKAAQAAFEAEVRYMQEAIEKQKKLRETQIEEVAKIREEMEKPLPPFFQALKDILVPIWARLQQIREVIRTLITGEMPGEDVLEVIGLTPERFSEIMLFLTNIRDHVVDFFNFLWRAIPAAIALVREILGPATQALWLEFMAMLPDLIALLAELLPIFVALAAVVGVAFLGGLKIVLVVLARAIKNFKLFLKGMQRFLDGIQKLVIGAVQFIIGLVTGNMDMLWRGIQNLGSGIFNYIRGILDMLIYMFTSSLNVIRAVVSDFVGDVLGSFAHLWNMLVRRSIVPDMLSDIASAFGGFFDTSRGIWKTGWADLATIAESSLEGIKPAIQVGATLGSLAPAPAAAGNSNFRFGSVNVYGASSPRETGDTVHDVLTKLFQEATAQLEKERS